MRSRKCKYCEKQIHIRPGTRQYIERWIHSDTIRSKCAGLKTQATPK